MKIKQTTSVLAIAALLGTAGMSYADSITSAFEGSVSVLSPDQTGFIIGGQVSVNGLGSGALTMTRSVAEMALFGSASSDPDFEEVDFDDYYVDVIDGADADASVTSMLRFDREITTEGSLVGQGAVVSRGEAIAALGSAGAASASTEIAGVNDNGEGSAAAEATAQGSLNGSLSTSNSLQLLGTSGLFAGSNGLTVGEENFAVAYGGADVTADSEMDGVQLDDIEFYGDDDEGYFVGGDGAVFVVSSDLTGDDNTIAMSVSNAGNGTISLTTSTGGFFTGGAAAGGSSSFVNNGSFFGAQP